MKEEENLPSRIIDKYFVYKLPLKDIEKFLTHLWAAYRELQRIHYWFFALVSTVLVYSISRSQKETEASLADSKS